MRVSGRKIAVKQISILLAQNVLKPFSAQKALVGASHVLVTYSWLHAESIYV